MTMKWFYVHGDVIEGPITSDVLQRLALAGTIGPQDLIWPEGSSRSSAVEAQSALLFPVSLPEINPLPDPPDPLPEPARSESVPVPLPDWLTDVQSADERIRSRPASGLTVPSGEGVPDWLQDFLGVPPAPPPPAPPASTEEPSPSSDLTGVDPLTGRVLDSDKFERWLAEQNVVRKTRLAMDVIPSLHERLQKAKFEIEQWADDAANRAAIVAADLQAIRSDAALCSVLSSYADWGPEMTDKLWRHVAFVVENRKKFYAAHPDEA